jgi:hypothetical protein
MWAVESDGHRLGPQSTERDARRLVAVIADHQATRIDQYSYQVGKGVVRLVRA